MASYTIQRKGPSLIVGEQYFRIDEIRFVDVVKQERPLILRLMVVNAAFFLFAALICTAASAMGAASLFTLWSCAEIIVIVAAGRKYALRINAGFGTTKAIISSDRAALEQARRRINELLSSQEGE